MGEFNINPVHNVHKKYRQVNFVNPYIFTPPVVIPVENTFIGGVASTINTPALLAAKLAIDVSRITGFSIVGSDIKCKITGSYVLPSYCFQADTNITYYRDIDNLVTAIGNACFQNTTLITELNFNGVLNSGTYYGSNIRSVLFKNCVTVPDFGFTNSGNIKSYYIPNATSLGATTGDNSVFLIGGGSSSIVGNIIYCHPSLATNNAGSTDGDLSYAISQGAIVRYVTNFTAPNQVTTLASGIIYKNAIQLNFTPPISTNAIDYYELYINGVYNKKITASGEYIFGLTTNTSYNFTVIAVDIFYNKSSISNIVTQSTNNTQIISPADIVASYGLSSGIDSKNAYNGTVGSSVSFVAGVNGNGANFNGTSNAYISVPDNSAFTFTNGTNDLPFSIKFNLKVTSNGTQFLVSKASGGFATNSAEWSVYNAGGNLNIFFANKTTGYISNNFASGLATGIWYNIIVTYSGSGVNSGIKLFINGVEKTSYTTGNSGTYVCMNNSESSVNIGQEKAGGGSYILNGIIDELLICSKELNSLERLDLQNSFY